MPRCYLSFWLQNLGCTDRSLLRESSDLLLDFIFNIRIWWFQLLKINESTTCCKRISARMSHFFKYRFKLSIQYLKCLMLFRLTLMTLLWINPSKTYFWDIAEYLYYKTGFAFLICNYTYQLPNPCWLNSVKPLWKYYETKSTKFSSTSYLIHTHTHTHIWHLSKEDSALKMYIYECVCTWWNYCIN